MPGVHTVHLALSSPTAINDGSAHIRLGITVKRSLSQQGDERSEEGSGQTRVKDALDVNDRGIGPGPLRESGVGTGGTFPREGLATIMRRS